MKKNLFKVLDVVLIILTIILIIYSAIPILEPVITPIFIASDKNTVSDYETISDIEQMIGLYYDGIVNNNLEVVNEICSYNNKKNKKTLETLSEKMPKFNDARIKSMQTNMLTNTVYKCKIILKDINDLNDNEDFHEIVIKLKKNRKEFKIYKDNWNLSN